MMHSYVTGRVGCHILPPLHVMTMRIMKDMNETGLSRPTVFVIRTSDFAVIFYVLSTHVTQASKRR